MTMWQPMSVGGRVQWTGDIWRLHAYAHPARTSYGVRSPACWSLYLHTEKVAGGTARTITEARRLAEAAMAEVSTSR